MRLKRSKYGVRRKESRTHKRRKHDIQHRIASHQEGETIGLDGTLMSALLEKS